LKLWSEKPINDRTYERYLNGNSDEESSLRARTRVSDRLLIDYVGKHPQYVRRLGNDSNDNTVYERYLRGDSGKRSSLRDGNGALDRLMIDYAGKHPHHIRRLGNDLPVYGDLLYGIATKEAALLLHTWDEGVDESVQYELTLSIFDFILSVYCDGVFQFLDYDKQAPLLLANALLFQVTGKDASIVDEGDILGGRSHTIRGVRKFLLVNQMKRKQSPEMQRDARGWLLGVEIARILCGNPDLSVELQVMARAVLIRHDAAAVVRFLLYNEPPSVKKRIELEKEYEKNINNLSGMVMYGRKTY